MYCYIHWCSDGLEMTVVALNKQALGHRSANDWQLLLSIDLATFYNVSSTRGLHLSPFGGLTFLPVFPTTTVALHHPYVSTCGIDEKLSKMAGSLVSYSWKGS